MGFPSAIVPPVAIAPSSMVSRSQQKGLSFIASVPITNTSTPLPQKCLILKFRSLTLNANQAKLLPIETWSFATNAEVYCTNAAQSCKHALVAIAASSSAADTDKNIQQLAEPGRPRSSREERNPKRLSTSAAQKVVLDHFLVFRYPLITDLAMREMIENNTLTFIVDKRADKNNIKAAAKDMFKIQTRKVNTLMTPDGNKKAYLMLTPNHKAVEVAKKIKFI